MGRPGTNFEARILRLTLLSGLPAVLVALAPLWLAPHAPKVNWTLSLIVLGTWLGLAWRVRELVIRPLQTLANLLAAIREGDFSIRGRPTDRSDALGAAMAEVNALGATLRAQRLGALEASALLDKVMAEIDVAVFAFDDQRRLALVNPAGERLLREDGPPKRLLGRSAAELGLTALLESDPQGRVDGILRGAAGPWELRRTPFRQDGREHWLVVLTDLQRVLREEERQAWMRLVRVLGHEINNSLAPIQSIAGNLATLLARPERPEDLDEDLERGLVVIERRAAALGRFLSAYARLARLPPPRLLRVSVPAWVQRVAELEERLPVEVQPGPDVTVCGDPDQLDQLLINLVRNAVDAALETGGGVQLRWRAGAMRVEVSVLDEGPGLAETGNLFVPFFTTKPGGSGIGLVLSRQIAEAHEGSLTLVNRGPEGPGCEARLTLPRPVGEPPETG
jgi:nitrogen fixation/metabolism regulation signal transduction histidine kinase